MDEFLGPDKLALRALLAFTIAMDPNSACFSAKSTNAWAHDGPSKLHTKLLMSDISYHI